MVIIRHELKTGRKNLMLWTLAIAFFLALCIFMFPAMETQMKDITDMFAGMGSFTAAFGLDRLNMGTLSGFYAVECGNILSVGGAFFAALIAIGALSKEESGHTAEFLYTHPVSRTRIMAEKLASVIIRLVVLNAVCMAVAVLSILITGNDIPWKEMFLLHTAYFFVQLEISLICFGISAFLKRGGLGAGIGIAVVLYFMNILANISDSAKAIKYFTPFGFAEGADLIADGKLEWGLVALGMCIGLAIGVAGFLHYDKKDINA